MHSISYNPWIFYGIISLFTFIYWYLIQGYNYWSKKGIKGPWPIPGFGTSIYTVLENRNILEVQWLKKYGKIYGVYEGNIPVLRLAEPEHIKDIMVKDFHQFTDKIPNPNRHPIADRGLHILTGNDWKRVRSIVSPIFTSGKLRKMFPLIKECLKDFMSALDKHSKSGQDLDMKLLYGQYTLDVLATCAFATKTNSYNDYNHLFVTNAMTVFAPSYTNFLLNTTLPTFLLKYFKINRQENLGSEKILDYFYGLIRNIIEARKNSKNSYNDFIDLMLNVEKNNNNVRDANDFNESLHLNKGEEEIEVEKKTLEKHMTENEIICNAHVFLLAGYETTATTLSFCTQELALNPEVQERLYSEVMSVVDSNGEIDYNLLSKLPYLDAVIDETLRLHAPDNRLCRTSSTDYKLGDTGFTIQKGQRIEVPVYAIHRCEEFYSKADQFIPERFLPENKHKLIPYTYLPFGVGPRNCIGMRFGLIVVKLALAQVVQHFKIVKSNNTDIPAVLTKSILFNIPKQTIVEMLKRT